MILDILPQLLNKQMIVLAFNKMSNYVGVIIDSDSFKFIFLDSLHGSHHEYFAIIQQFFTRAFRKMELNPPNLELELDTFTIKGMTQQYKHS